MVKEKAGEVRVWESLECEVAEGRRSRLPQDKLTFTLTFTRCIQTTPYLITLICILSRGVPFFYVGLVALHCARIALPFEDKMDSPLLPPEAATAMVRFPELKG